MRRRKNPVPQRRRRHRATAPYNNPIPRTFATSEGKTYNFDDVLPLTSEVFEIYNESEGAFDLQDVAKVDKAMKFWSEFQPKKSRHYLDQYFYENLRLGDPGLPDAPGIPLRKSDWDEDVRDWVETVIQWQMMHLEDAFSDDPDGLDLEDRAKIEEGIKEIRVNPVARTVARRRNPTVDLADLHPSEMKDSFLREDYYLARNIIAEAVVNEVKNRPHIKVDRLGKIVDIDYREDTYGYPQGTTVVDSRNLGWRDHDGPSLRELLAKHNPRRRRRLKRY